MHDVGFDRERYLALQGEHIEARRAQFGGKLYLEFGGKLVDDMHASRVLPGFTPDNKIVMLAGLADEVEIVVVVNAQDFSRHKVRADLGISYEDDVLRHIDEFRDYGLHVGSVVISHWSNEHPQAAAFKLFGFGINPRGPSKRAYLPNFAIYCGVATSTSKFKSSLSSCLVNSSSPIVSAPAFLAASCSLSGANTATRTSLPVP